MGRIVSNFFISMDGVVERPDQWHFPYFDDEMGEVVGSGMASTAAILMGHRLYDEWSQYWPAQGDRTRPAAALNSRPKHVASTTLTATTWAGSSLLDGDLDAAVRALKAEPGRELQVHGSAVLVHSLAALDLVDGYRFIVAPVVAGSGVRLLEAGSAPVAFRLAESRTAPGGAQLQTYERTGPAETGIWAP